MYIEEYYELGRSKRVVKFDHYVQEIHFWAEGDINAKFVRNDGSYFELTKQCYTNDINTMGVFVLHGNIGEGKIVIKRQKPKALIKLRTLSLSKDDRWWENYR